MPQLRILGFDGVVPRRSPTMLDDNQAQVADNVKLYAQELRYWRGPELAYSPATSGSETIYRYYASAPDPRWLNWTTDVDVVTSPNADTTDYRIYYTDGAYPKKSNEALITTGSGDYPRDYLHMGVPAPSWTPTATRVGSGADPETRVYTVTYVSTFGSLQEESAPSAASAEVLCGTGDSVTVGLSATIPSTKYNITSIRIYRSVTGATTSSYLFVAEVPAGTTSYSDSVTSAALGEALGTVGWDEPPTDLAGLTSIAGGSLAGFVGNTVYFSEPYFPHAWPVSYALTVPHQIVGIAGMGSSLVVMTERFPYLIHGIPGAQLVERVPMLEPCISKGSIVSSQMGILYSSPNGLVLIGTEQRQLISTPLFRRDEWQDINPSGFKAVMFDNKYIALYNSSTWKSFALSPDDKPALSNIDITATAAHVDSSTGKLFYVNTSDSKIYEADADEDNPLFYEWKSKRFVFARGLSFSALKLDAEFNQADLAVARAAQIAAVQAANATIFATGTLNGALNTTPLDTYDVNGSALVNPPSTASARSAQILLYGDSGNLETTLTIDSWDPVRIPAFRAREFEVKIVGNMNVRALLMATTVDELHE